jgi:hypothetical protein
MPRDGAIIFSDLTSKLDVRRVVCDKCAAPVVTGSAVSSISVASTVACPIGSTKLLAIAQSDQA